MRIKLRIVLVKSFQKFDSHVKNFLIVVSFQAASASCFLLLQSLGIACAVYTGLAVLSFIFGWITYVWYKLGVC